MLDKKNIAQNTHDISFAYNELSIGPQGSNLMTKAPYVSNTTFSTTRRFNASEVQDQRTIHSAYGEQI